ncbi:large ribosomal subunit protein eL34 [Penaeus vannamei]|uniref:Large ribosomal subunit protein eL34 n=1 Tax=Penaeus vannamei TaxID=6689 RepID=A0A423T7F3_PENVA|nr:60S ribosomal protein L34-like [Penaeus vannamei]XP_027218452.1 60S ribosomal protein L34-like [Penaeus vannamei]XP_027218453.1 60S ribosomal protein L34-like [Penaeus vannamei]MDK2413293.1 60S ribosomal protein L34 [Aphanizomenon sp. 202]ROT72381.1 ribosomal protein rpl34 [Penaeus vannamei]
MVRLTLRRRLSYNTASNKRRIVRTPGGRLVYQYVKKRGKRAACGNCKRELAGVVRCRPYELKRMPKYKKKVARAYGGSLCHTCVRERVVRAFLIEEQKIVVKVLKAQKAAAAAAGGSKK